MQEAAGLDPRNYPRWRGEQTHWSARVMNPWELPPLARGTVAPGPARSRTGGITPAGAGNRGEIDIEDRRGRNYPRWRGEQPGPPTAHASVPELPPLARGTGQRTPGRAGRIGITPAGAGNRPVQQRLTVC